MGRRLPNGRKPKDSCMITLLVGGSLVTGLSYLVSEAARWVL